MNRALTTLLASALTFGAVVATPAQAETKVGFIYVGPPGDLGWTYRHDIGRQAVEAMDGFTALAPLRVGDVVTVQPWQPHSLQHGVRVVEFQTPTYERYILSFGQRVLTQNHWDTEAVLDRIELDPPQPESFVPVADGIQQIADFDDFSAFRVEIPPGVSRPLEVELPYAVCMGVEGCVSVNGLAVDAEEACFVPASALPVTLTNAAATPAVTLVAAARL